MHTVEIFQRPAVRATRFSARGGRGVRGVDQPPRCHGGVYYKHSHTRTSAYVLRRVSYCVFTTVSQRAPVHFSFARTSETTTVVARPSHRLSFSLAHPLPSSAADDRTRFSLSFLPSSRPTAFSRLPLALPLAVVSRTRFSSRLRTSRPITSTTTSVKRARVAPHSPSSEHFFLVQQPSFAPFFIFARRSQFATRHTRHGPSNDAPATEQLLVRVRLRGELPTRVDAAMDDRELDQRVLLLHHLRPAGVRASALDARPCRVPAQRAAGAVEHDAGHVQSGRVRAHGARTVPRTQQIRSAPLGVRYQVSVTVRLSCDLRRHSLFLLANPSPCNRTRPRASVRPMGVAVSQAAGLRLLGTLDVPRLTRALYRGRVSARGRLCR